MDFDSHVSYVFRRKTQERRKKFSQKIHKKPLFYLLLRIVPNSWILWDIRMVISSFKTFWPFGVVEQSSFVKETSPSVLSKLPTEVVNQFSFIGLRAGTKFLRLPKS